MKFPQRLAYLLERDQALDGAVKSSVAHFEPWLKNSTPPFFPEYTKHDIDHIEGVLRAASGLIRDEAWETTTPADAAVLIVSVLLHDCALHLTEDGFAALLHPTRSGLGIDGFGDKPWALLWEEFLSEARRFDGRRLLKLFGDTQPVRRPPLASSELTFRDRLLIGEFVRRHHPRLAHEIAVYGVPSVGSSPLLLQGFSEALGHIRDLAGLVARSHGAPVRAYLPFLRERFDLRQFKGIHPVFLMTLLRVADYFQIEAERAPVQVLQVKKLASPVSDGEWRAHEAIKDVRHTHEDPEALYIDALPGDATTFFRVQSWLQGIQAELDASWAVIGEVFGRYEGLNKLGLVLRRVRSSIDDLEQLAGKVSYLPLRAAFRVSDADLLKLLIEPLYGDRPEIALRELIQNAVDAVRELAQLRIELAESSGTLETEERPEVEIALDRDPQGGGFVSVSDSGIGMTASIVIDYFLTAGASFRRSEEWRRIFENSDGRSKVLRAGRFGVGALASFLLGPEIEVTTRHAEQATGIGFRASVESDLIELKYVDRPVGTTVKIRISEEMLGRLEADEWDWYCLEWPSVSRSILGRKLNQRWTVPDRPNRLPRGWRRLGQSTFSDVLWTHGDAPGLVCNGIRVGETAGVYSGHRYESHSWERDYGLTMPNVAVFDPDGLLRLNLQRTELVDDGLPFNDLLATEVIDDFLAFALVKGPEEWPDGEAEVARYPGSRRRGAHTYDYPGRPEVDWLYTSDGFSYLDGGMIGRMGLRSIIVARGFTREVGRYSETAAILMEEGGSAKEVDQWLREVLWSVWEGPKPFHRARWDAGGDMVLRTLRRDGVRMLLTNGLAERLHRLPKTLLEALTFDAVGGGWALVTMGDCPSETVEFMSLLREAGSGGGRRVGIVEHYIAGAGDAPLSPISVRWLKIFGQEVIPYEIKARKLKLAKAYGRLAKYVSAHQDEVGD